MHRKTSEAIAQEFNSNLEKGLSSNQVQEYQAKYGSNELIKKKKTPLIVKFLEQFTDVLIIILLIAAALSFIIDTSEWVDSLIILIVVMQDIYDVGDYVEIKGHQGNVIQLGLKTTTIRSYKGEICTINNRNVGDVINYTKADDALTITLFRVSPNTNIEHFYEVFAANVEEIVAKYPEIVVPPKIVGTNAISDWAIEFQINTVVKPGSQWQFRRSMGDELIRICQANGIDLPGEK